jgi:hypothetical protein
MEVPKHIAVYNFKFLFKDIKHSYLGDFVRSDPVRSWNIKVYDPWHNFKYKKVYSHQKYIKLK